MIKHALVLLLATSVAACSSARPAVRTSAPSPAAKAYTLAPVAGVNVSQLFAQLDSITETAISDSVTPGGIIAIARHGQLVAVRPFGRTEWSANAPLVTDSTIYDLASLTKVIATTTAAMILEQDSLLDLDRTVASYVPEFNAPDKATMTVRQLLLHRSGLKQVAALHEKYHGLTEYITQINAIPLRSLPGERSEYTDWNMVVLQAVIVNASGGKPFDAFVRDRIFTPLGMHDTGFNPGPALRARAAPTRARGGNSYGVVHDPTGFALDGVSGNAGLFSSGRDLAVFAQMLLNGGEHHGVRILQPSTITRWTARQQKDATRALGWDTPADSSSAGRYMSPWSFGHTGFTGTSMWVDPNADMFVVMLTNYARPSSNNPRIRSLRWAVDNAVRSAVMDMPIRDWQSDAKQPVRK